MNASAHAFNGAVLVFGTHAAHDLNRHGRVTPEAFFSGLAASCVGSLPDWIEPAHNPHHRQFFHSVAVAAFVGYLAYKAYRWEPETPAQRLARWAALIGAGAYLAHLVCDASTPRSLPWIGKV